MADVKKKDVVIQLKRIAFADNSFAIVGIAMLSELPINGVKKEAIVTINKM
jgi:hypothetical protein